MKISSTDVQDIKISIFGLKKFDYASIENPIVSMSFNLI